MTKSAFRKEYSEIRADARWNGNQNIHLYHPKVMEVYINGHWAAGNDPIQFSRQKPGEQWTVSRVSGRSLH